MRFLKWLIFLLISLVVVVFAISNREPIDIYFFFNDSNLEIPLFVFFFISILIGIILSGSGTIFYKIRVQNNLRQSKKRIKALENEIAALKIESRVSESLPAGD